MAKVFQVDSGASLTTNLVSYYQLEDVTDFYSSNDLTNTGSTPFNPAKIKNGGDQGSSNSTKYFDVASALGIDGGSISIAGWVNLNSAPSGDARCFFFQGNNTSKVENAIYYRDLGGGSFRLEFLRTRVGIADDGILYTVTLTTGTFYHLVITYDGTNVRGYVNGAEVTGSPVAASGNGSGATSNRFSIGASFRGSAGVLSSAIIDEVGVWSKKLSTTEITELYNGATGQTMLNSSKILKNNMLRPRIFGPGLAR